MKPTDEELEAAANRFAGLAKTMRQMKAASIKAHELDNVVALLRACKGQDDTPACPVERTRAVAEWFATKEDLPNMPDCYQPRAVAFAMYRCAKALAALEQEHHHE